jgi:branched-chain amino acid aminotransferase
MAYAFAKQRGSGEAIFANTKGELCEGTGSNIFLVKDGQLLTPPLAAGCLAGVTRALVLELCEQEGIEVEERAVPITALHQASEAFLTGTTRGILPIVEVDGQAVAGGEPGPVTQRLIELFDAAEDRLAAGGEAPPRLA